MWPSRAELPSRRRLGAKWARGRGELSLGRSAPKSAGAAPHVASFTPVEVLRAGKPRRGHHTEKFRPVVGTVEFTSRVQVLGWGWLPTKCWSKGLPSNCAISCLFIGIPLFAGPSARWGWECKERQSTVRSTVVREHVGRSPMRRLSPEAGGRWVLGWTLRKGWQGFHLGFRTPGFTLDVERKPGPAYLGGALCHPRPAWEGLLGLNSGGP